MSDTTTRSGMLWEVERILKELKETNSLPQVLLMENVPMVHSADNTQDFNKWQLELTKLGYKNYWEDLIATDYGIPQTRNRCFMVSILGDYNYTFPKPIPLEKKLKDMLEDQVDEKYFLSDKMINCFLAENKDSKFPRKERFLQTFNTTNNKSIAATITTGAGNRATDNFILTKDTENYIEWEDGKNIQMNCRAWKDDKVVATLNTGGETKILTNKSLQKTIEQNKIKDTCYIDTYNKRIDEEKAGTITTGVSSRNNTFLAIKNATKKGYTEAEDGDGIDISSRMEYHRGTVQKGKTQTINTMGGENNGVVVDTLKRNLCNKLIEDNLVEEGDVVKHSYTQQILDGNKKCVEKNDGNMITLTTRGDCVGTAVKDTMNNLRIRKLTPKECFRLMGVKDEDYEKCAKNQTDSSLYHLAGDSIVVNVLMAIFKEML